MTAPFFVVVIARLAAVPVNTLHIVHWPKALHHKKHN